MICVDKVLATAVMWHFSCDSDGKYYIMPRCCPLWQPTYQCKGSRPHSTGAQVLVPRRKQRICMSCFPFQISIVASWPTWPKLDQFHCHPVKWGRNKKLWSCATLYLKFWIEISQVCMIIYFYPIICMSQFYPKWVTITRYFEHMLLYWQRN